MRHPAAGIVAALRAAAHEVCVVLPVDCPLMTPLALRALGEACADASRPAGDAGPIPGAFRRTVLPVLERCLAEQASIGRALAGCDVRLVPLDPLLYADADTAAELAALAAERPDGATPPSRSPPSRGGPPPG